jgi:hypothetical protein
MAAVRVSMSWMGTRKTLTAEQRGSRRAVRSQCSILVGWQEADRHQPPGLQGGNGHSG